MSLYRVTGTVTADDGTSYDPLFFGDWWGCCRVRDAILSGARERGEAVRVAVDREGNKGWVRVGLTYWDPRTVEVRI